MTNVIELNKEIKLNKSEQFVVDWQYRRLGGFMSKLADCIAHADTSNQKRLVKAFPDEAQGIINFQSKEGYWDSIQDKLDTIKEKREWM